MGALRWVLAAIVVLDHAGGPLPSFGATAAVQAFFVISGYYMAATYTANYQGRFGIARFYISRFTRLFPLYLAMLLGMMILVAAWPHKFAAVYSFRYFLNGQDLLQHLSTWSLLGQDIISISERRHLDLPIRAAWSISAELVFYLMTPLLLRFGGHLGKLTALFLAIKIAADVTGGFRISYFPFVTNVCYFTLGMLAFRHRDTLCFGKPSTYALLSVFLAMCFSGTLMAFEYQPRLNIAMAGLLAILIPSLSRHFDTRWSSLAGDLSYGIYIVHLPLVDVMRVSGFDGSWSLPLYALVSTTIIAFAFEHLVQKHVDRLRHKLLYDPSRARVGEVITAVSAISPPLPPANAAASQQT
jgi:peptidoglycan/LPS O-acetylase OafA/YrhL